MEFPSLSRRRSSSRNFPPAAMSEEKRLLFAGIPESQKILNVESGILDLGIGNTAVGNRNPTKDFNPESKFQ